MQYTLLIERMRVIDILFDIEIRGSKSIDSTGHSKKHIMESRPVSAMGRAIERLKMKKNIGAKYLVFVSSCSLKTRELSLAQFVYFLRKVCLFFNS